MDTASRLIKGFILELVKSSDVSPSTVALTVYEREPEIVKQWTIQNLVRTAKRQINTLPPPPSPFQNLLPGFRSIDERLKLREGSVRLSEASVRQLHENLKVLKASEREAIAGRRERLQTQIEERAKLIKDMARYRKPRQKLTVAEYCEMKAAGTLPAVPARKRAGKRVK